MKPARQLPQNQSAHRFASAIERSPRRFTNESPSANFLSLGEYVFLGLLLSIGLALRLDFLIASNFVIDADEAVPRVGWRRRVRALRLYGIKRSIVCRRDLL